MGTYMLDWVLYYRTGIARVLAVILATATAFYIEERYGVARYWAWGSALVVYLIVPVLWGLFLDLWARPTILSHMLGHANLATTQRSTRSASSSKWFRTQSSRAG